MIARFDVDGFRIDALRYLKGGLPLLFGNSVREFALSVGKKNFFTFGEVFVGDAEEEIARFIGRTTTDQTDMVGVDAALDYPLLFNLKPVVSEQATNRYLQALAPVDDGTRLEELIRPLEGATPWKGKRVRALHPFPGSDASLLEAVARGEFLVNGFRNRDLQRVFFAQAPDSVQEKRRRSARVSRPIRLLRAHGLIRKVAHANRYHVTQSGRQVIGAILAARQATLSQLSKAA